MFLRTRTPLLITLLPLFFFVFLNVLLLHVYLLLRLITADYTHTQRHPLIKHPPTDPPIHTHRRSANPMSSDTPFWLFFLVPIGVFVICLGLGCWLSRRNRRPAVGGTAVTAAATPIPMNPNTDVGAPQPVPYYGNGYGAPSPPLPPGGTTTTTQTTTMYYSGGNNTANPNGYYGGGNGMAPPYGPVSGVPLADPSAAASYGTAGAYGQGPTSYTPTPVQPLGYGGGQPNPTANPFGPSSAPPAGPTIMMGGNGLPPPVGYDADGNILAPALQQREDAKACTVSSSCADGVETFRSQSSPPSGADHLSRPSSVDEKKK